MFLISSVFAFVQLFSFKLSRSYNLDHGFYKLSQVSTLLITQVTYLSHYLGLTRTDSWSIFFFLILYFQRFYFFQGILIFFKKKNYVLQKLDSYSIFFLTFEIKDEYSRERVVYALYILNFSSYLEGEIRIEYCKNTPPRFC